MNTFPRRIPDPSNHSNHAPSHFLLSPTTSSQRGPNTTCIQSNVLYDVQEPNKHLISPRNKTTFNGQSYIIPLQDMTSNGDQNQSLKAGSSQHSSAAPAVPPRVGSNLKSSQESLASGDPQQRLSGQQSQQPARKTVTFKGDVQTIQCSPEEQQERRCWRHQARQVSGKNISESNERFLKTPP